MVSQRMQYRWWVALPISFLVAVALVSSGCSSTPRSRGFQGFYGNVDEAHDRLREYQEAETGGKFLEPRAELDLISKRMKKSECFKIVANYSQWGIYEPEMVFFGESTKSSDRKAYIFVAPQFDEGRVYPTPSEEKKLKVFRVDRNAPHGDHLVAQLQKITGKSEYCAKLVRLEPQEPEDEARYTVVGLMVTQSGRANRALPIDLPKVSRPKPVKKASAAKSAEKPAAQQNAKKK